MLVDSHCHLDFPDFENELDDVVARASDAGIKYMVTICTKVREFDRIHSVAERYEISIVLLALILIMRIRKLT